MYLQDILLNIISNLKDCFHNKSSPPLIFSPNSLRENTWNTWKIVGISFSHFHPDLHLKTFSRTCFSNAAAKKKRQLITEICFSITWGFVGWRSVKSYGGNEKTKKKGIYEYFNHSLKHKNFNDSDTEKKFIKK